MMRSLKAFAVYFALTTLTTLWIVGPITAPTLPPVLATAGASTVSDVTRLASDLAPAAPIQPEQAAPPVRSFDFLPSPPAAQVAPEAGRVSIQLVNTIGAPITYQVVTDTAQRSLPANSDVVLQDLTLPVSIFLYRPDTGLIQAEAAAEPGRLQLTLEAATDLADNVRSVELDSSGYVFFE